LNTFVFSVSFNTGHKKKSAPKTTKVLQPFVVGRFLGSKEASISAKGGRWKVANRGNLPASRRDLAAFGDKDFASLIDLLNRAPCLAKNQRTLHCPQFPFIMQSSCAARLYVTGNTQNPASVWNAGGVEFLLHHMFCFWGAS